MTYYITPNPAATSNKTIFTSQNGGGVVKNGELHLTDAMHHYIYKQGGAPAGWYMKNAETNEDYYLGEGASPTLELDDITIKSPTYWESIVVVPPDTEE